MNLPSSPGRLRLVALLALVLVPSVAGCRQGPWRLWNSYSARFIDQEGRVIDPQGQGRTTSEGQSYALFFALAGNDRARFDRVLEWTQENLAQGDLNHHLPAWLWGKDKDGKWRTLDPNSAADADLWIAYTLIEAGRLWNQSGYDKMGRQLLEQIATHEVADLTGFGPMLLPGPVGFQHGGTWTLNPSYLPVFLFERAAAVDPTGPWKKIAVGIPRLIREGSPKGYAMDWVSYVPGDGFAPSSQFPSVSADPPMGSYDAIRVYMWAGMMNEDDTARADILDALPSMANYLATHDAPPEKVSSLGIPSDTEGNAGFSAAVIPYLKAIPGTGRLIAKQTVRLNSLKDSSTGMYGKDLTYYDQNLALFATGFLDGRFRFGSDGSLKVGWTRS